MRSILLGIIAMLGLGMVSCQEQSIGHIEATRLVMLEKIPESEGRFDENFRSALELLYPYMCHDTVFIQEQVFLERIDPAPAYQRELAIAPNLMRDFFGSNNPEKKRTLREDLLFFGDTCFENRPDPPFLRDTLSDPDARLNVIEKYLSRSRKSALVYFLGNDTAKRQYNAGGQSHPVFFDYAKLNCRIVSDLRIMTREDQLHTTVIIILLPQDPAPTAVTSPKKPAIKAKKPQATVQGGQPATSKRGDPSAVSPCPADSTISRFNRQYSRIIVEFRNLLFYIATTHADQVLRRKYREDAWTEINRIPGVVIEGIPGEDLRSFLNSEFSKNVKVLTLKDRCGLITGVSIQP